MHTIIECGEGIVVNKYGAVDLKVIAQILKDLRILKGRCLHLENTIARIAGVEFSDGPIKGFEEIVKWDTEKRAKIRQLPEDIKKMKELTHCNDYEFQTTPAKTTLVKRKDDR